jgi:lipopolysaccharide export system permease protein
MTIYIAKMFAMRVIAVLMMLVMVLQMLDLLSESGQILAHAGNGQAQLLTYVGLRVPQLVARFLPYSVLLATIITLITLNQNSEVIAMKAAGLSAHQVLAPLFLVAGVISVGNFAFNERIVTRATATLKAWQDADYGPLPTDTTIRSNVWLQDGPNILYARTVTGEGNAMKMTDVTWHRRDPTGMVTEIVRAPSAAYANPGWRLAQATAFDVQSAAGHSTSELESRWWHKISGPLSAMLMPLLGAVAAFGLARSGQLFMRAVIGMALGFAYFVVDNAALAMGSFGGYPPLIAAWAPFVLFLLIGETVLIRTEE